MGRGVALPVVCLQSEPPSGWKISTKTKTCVACRSVAFVCPHRLRARSPSTTARIPTPQPAPVTQQRVRRQCALAIPSDQRGRTLTGTRERVGGRATTQCPYCLDEMCDVTSLCQHVECQHPYEYKVRAVVMRAQGLASAPASHNRGQGDTTRSHFESIRSVWRRRVGVCFSRAWRSAKCE